MISVREYLYKKGFQFIEKGRNGAIEGIMNCPFCDPPDKERKFAVNLDTGAWNCKHINRCGLKGSFRELQKKMGDAPQKTYKDPFANRVKKVYVKPKKSMPEISSPEMEYLASRGLTKKTIDAFKVTGKDGVVMLPYYKHGELINIKYRSVREKKIWAESNAEPSLFGRDMVEGNILYICEGEFDAMCLWQMGFTDGAVSVSNGVSDHRWIETEWEWIDRFKEIYLIMDMDDAGRTAAAELSKKLGTWRCKDVILPFKDVNECLLNGFTIETMSECMSDAREYSPAVLIDSAAMEEDVIELFKNKHLMGTPTMWGKLDELLGGWRNEELTIWTGRTGAGKSTILNQHIIDTSSKDIRTCAASLELPAPRYLRWALIQMFGTSDLTESQIREGLKRLANRLFIVNTHETIDPENLLEAFEYAARRFNCKHFIVDSLMRIKLQGVNDLKEEKEFINQLLSFAKKYSCHVHLVAHPRKATKDQDVPGMVDIKGSGDITNLAHNVLMHWRPTEEEIEKAKAKKKSVPGGILYVLKNRELGRLGRVKLTFNETSKCYKDDFDEMEEVNERQRAY